LAAISQQDTTIAHADRQPLESTLGSSTRLTAEERKAILDQQVAAAVARGGRVTEWWGRGRFEAVVSYHRYLPGRRWTYTLRLLVLGLLFTPWRAAVLPLLGEFAEEGSSLGAVLTVGVIALWAGRTRYERLTVDEDGVVKVTGAGLFAGAAGLTLYVGLASTIFGGGHLQGVISVAMARGYAYDFRLAALLLLGMTMVFAGVFCLTAVRGLARGQRRDWDRAMMGTILLLLVTVPITPLPVQGELAAFQAFPASVNLIAMLAAWRQLEVG
jgi:hypothetical protein